MELHQIGTEEFYLRPSKLDFFVVCSMRYALDIGEPEDEGGPAAQTGSLFHEAVAAYHSETSPKVGEKAAWAQMQLQAGNFPLASEADVRIMLTHYLADPRNTNAEIVAVEQQVQLILEPDELDETKQPIYIKGTLDQIRLHHGKQYVYDLKTGTPSALDMQHAHVYQLAAYLLGARESGYAPIGAKILRIQAYRTRGADLPSPDGVFIDMPFDVEMAKILMERVRLQVARFRNGYLDFGPGHACTYCRHGGLAACGPTAIRKFVNGDD